MRRTVARVGKMDAKKHLDTQLNQLMSANILQCMCVPPPATLLPRHLHLARTCALGILRISIASQLKAQRLCFPSMYVTPA